MLISFTSYRQEKTIEECIDDMHAYTNLTDDVLQVIRVSKDPQLAESRELLKAFDSRDLFRCVAESKPSKDFTKVRIIHLNFSLKFIY